jgi:predicted acylesterase/phospholipase RssA
MASDYQPKTDRKGIALCFSGGGFRASLFHLGSLRRLNEVGLLSQVNTITSVSGSAVALCFTGDIGRRARSRRSRSRPKTCLGARFRVVEESQPFVA